MEFRLPSGRVVRLNELHVVPTRTDWNAAGENRHLSHLVTRFFGPSDVPTYVKDPRSTILPPLTCVASLVSDPLERRGHAIENSLLVVCWYTDRVDTPLRTLVCEGLSGLEWERHARDTRSEW